MWNTNCSHATPQSGVKVLNSRPFEYYLSLHRPKELRQRAEFGPWDLTPFLLDDVISGVAIPLYRSLLGNPKQQTKSVRDIESQSINTYIDVKNKQTG